jgi:hypothetical protein
MSRKIVANDAFDRLPAPVITTSRRGRSVGFPVAGGRTGLRAGIVVTERGGQLSISE